MIIPTTSRFPSIGTTAAIGILPFMLLVSPPNDIKLMTGEFATNNNRNPNFGGRYFGRFEGQSKATSTLDGLSAFPNGLNAEQNLAHIEAVLKPSVTELASALDVTRQAIYDWKKGNQINPDNSEKLRDLAAAADAFVGQDEQFIHHILRRKIGGHNFFGRVGNGESPINMAKKLLEIAQTELRQREMISAQLKDRPARTNIIAVPGRHYQDENG